MEPQSSHPTQPDANRRTTPKPAPAEILGASGASGAAPPPPPKVDPVKQEGPPATPANAATPRNGASGPDGQPAAGAPQAAPGRFGVRFARFFSTAGVDPFDTVEWELRDALITNEKGETVFEQRGVEIPRGWSQTATNVVVSKYFRGQLGTPQRESSVRQLIGRVVDTISGWGDKQGYFA